MKLYKIGERTAKNYNEWMEYIYKEITNKKKIYFKKMVKNLDN